MPLIRSISGLRGTIGDGLTPAVVVQYVRAFARFCGRGRIIVGWDGRPSGAWIERTVERALRTMAMDVTLIGMAPTPTVQLATERSDAVGGISITASHNPAEWNGLKFLGPDGIFLGPDDCTRLFDLVDREEGGPLSADLEPDETDRSARGDAVEEHVELALSLPFVNIDALQSKRFFVVVDAVNASGSRIVPLLLDRCGCRVLPLFCDGSGVFPHTPEPLPENLTDLSRAVVENGADFGIAVDPDADRLVVIDENGQPFGEEYTVTQCADFILRRARAHDPTADLSVVVNLSTTRAIDDVARRHGASVERTPVGEINVARKMLEIGSIIGGEGSGGVILPELHAGRDSIVGIVILLSNLLETGMTPSELRASLPSYVIVKKKLELPDGSSVGRMFDDLAESAPLDATIRREDGIRIDLEEGWVHIRASNTEPIVRVIAEAHSADAAERLADLYLRRLASS